MARSDPVEQVVEVAAEQPAPVLADVAELADERLRGLPGRLAQEFEQALPVPPSRRRTVVRW